jgi:hypothetical protein
MIGRTPGRCPPLPGFFVLVSTYRAIRSYAVLSTQRHGSGKLHDAPVSDQIPEFSPQGPQLVYVAVADHIAARIRAGDLRPGARLPSERDLAQEYGVAYMSVRRAAEVLRERGLITTVHGKGTYVADPLPESEEQA